MSAEGQLSRLVKNDTPGDVWDEVRHILHLISADFDDALIYRAFGDTMDLFCGRYPGYRACNTEYHDIHHTLDTFLTMARMFHGAVIEGEAFDGRHISLGLLAALLHDSGYIQEDEDREGTGSKFTAYHVQRSMLFFADYGTKLGLSDEEKDDGLAIILCTDPAIAVSTILFSSNRVALLGKMLGASDLFAQMADRVYLEKLLFLYHEFREAGVGDYDCEVDLLRKTVGFYEFISKRLERTLDSANGFISAHLSSRWGIQVNLYEMAIERQKDYLQEILKRPDSDPRDNLKRGGIVERVRKIYYP